MSGRIVQVDPRVDARWDTFVESTPGASVYHLAAWARILRVAYGFRPHYLALQSAGGELEGVLPMFHSRGPLTGSRLRSIPAITGPSGPLARTRQGLAALVRAADEAVGRRNAKEWIWHTRTPGLEREFGELECRSTLPTWITPLAADPDEMRKRLRKSSNNLHRSIKKAETADLAVRASTEERDLRAFYRLYLETMREHRAIPRPYRQMLEDLRVLGPSGTTHVFVVEHGGSTVAGGLFHAFGDTVELLYNGSDRGALELRPNHALYWHVMQWAIERGLRCFDFGDAPPDSSLANFKRQWAAEPVDEFVYALSGDSRSGPASTPRPPRIGGGRDATSLASRVWSRAPLAFTRVAGSIAYRL